MGPSIRRDPSPKKDSAKLLIPFFPDLVRVIFSDTAFSKTILFFNRVQKQNIADTLINSYNLKGLNPLTKGDISNQTVDENDDEEDTDDGDK